MRRIRFAGALVAGCAALALAPAVAAAALPEFSGPFPKGFTSTSGVTTLQTAGGTKVVCKADTNAGQMTAPKEGTVTFTFTGCESSGLPCNTAGRASGEIVTNDLTATLLYRNRERRTVGLRLSSPPTGAPFMQFECAGVAVVVRGAATGALTPVNKPVKPPKGHYVLKFAKAKGLEVSVGGGPAETSTFTATDNLFFSELTEVKA